jgi:tripartite-type tricarboxylate transporter receptor subunit TctC
MTQLRYLFLSLAALVAASSGVLAVAHAQTYPTRPVRLVVGFAPGGPTDVLARAISPKFSELLGHSLIVDNRPGANGNIGMELVARASPDGYTLLFGDMAFVVNPSIYKSLPFNMRKDFSPVGFAGSTPQVFVVPPGVEARTMADFIAWAKARQGKLSYGSAGNGSPPHLAGELFKIAHGLDILAVHYKGTGLALPDLLSGRLHMMMTSSAVTKPYIDTGRLQALAISGAKRSSGLPTFAEAGTPLPDLDFGAWWGIYAPAGVPRNVIARLNDVLQRTIALPEVRNHLAIMQIETAPMSMEAFGKFVLDQQSKWAQVIQRAKITAD